VDRSSAGRLPLGGRPPPSAGKLRQGFASGYSRLLGKLPGFGPRRRKLLKATSVRYCFPAILTVTSHPTGRQWHAVVRDIPASWQNLCRLMIGLPSTLKSDLRFMRRDYEVPRDPARELRHRAWAACPGQQGHSNAPVLGQCHTSGEDHRPGSGNQPRFTSMPNTGTGLAAQSSASCRCSPSTPSLAVARRWARAVSWDKNRPDNEATHENDHILSDYCS